MDQLVPFQFWTLHKCFPTFSTHMNPGSMSVEVFPHCWVITKHLGASLVWACYCPVHSITHLFLHFHLVTRSRIVKYTTCYHLYSNTSHFKTSNYIEYMQVQTQVCEENNRTGSLKTFLRNFHTAKNFLEPNVNTNPSFYNKNKVWHRPEFFS